MQSFHKILAIALLAATATGAQAEGALDLHHVGDDRHIRADLDNSDLRIVSRGDGGVIDAGIFGSTGVTVYALGDDTEARLRLRGASDVTVMSGLCPPGMSQPAASATGASDILLILTCQ